MALSIDFRNERVSLSKEQTYEALNAYLENASFVTSEATRTEWETWERNLKASPHIDATYQRVLKEKNDEFNKHNTLAARLDITVNRLKNIRNKDVKRKQEKSLKQKVKNAFKNSELYLIAGAVSAVAVAGAAAGLSFFGSFHGIDPQFCSSVLSKGVTLGGQILAAGTALTATRMSVSASLSNKGGKELLKAQEDLKNLKQLKQAFMVIEQKDRFRKNNDFRNINTQSPSSAFQSAHNEKAVISSGMMNKIKDAKVY